MSAPTIDIARPDTWPLRMKWQEIAAVMRWSRRTFYARIEQGRFPRADDGRTWSRDVVRRYAEGGIREFERVAARMERRNSMKVVSR